MEIISKKKEEYEEEELFYSPRKMEEVCWNNLEEREKVDDLRQRIQKQDSVNMDALDDLTLRRFLHARDLDVEKASEMLLKYSAWRRMFVPKGSISASEVPNQVAHDKVFMQGKDKRGCPIAVILGAKHFPPKGDIDEFKRYVVFALDKICSRMPIGEQKFIIIVDLKGYGYSNVDIRGYTAALSILQEFYPERLWKMYLVHAPYIFMAAWKIIYPFIDKRTRKRIIFVENKKLHSTLLEEIEENQLPHMYGGKLQLVSIQHA